MEKQLNMNWGNSQRCLASTRETVFDLNQHYVAPLMYVLLREDWCAVVAGVEKIKSGPEECFRGVL